MVRNSHRTGQAANSERTGQQTSGPAVDATPDGLDTTETAQATDAVEGEAEPEHFPIELLSQPPGARQRFFEREVIIEHARLLQCRDAVIEMVCTPEDNVQGTFAAYTPGCYSGTTESPPLSDTLHARGDCFRLPSMVLVIGPSRVGKTTLVGLLRDELQRRAFDQMRADPGCIPFVVVSAEAPRHGRFDFRRHYEAVLKALGDPFVHVGPRGRPVRRADDLQDAMTDALILRHTKVVIVDEGHHFAKAATGRGLEDHFDHLKDLEIVTGVSHVLVGTYAMQAFRKVSVQISLRTHDVHFSRYDATQDEDRISFQRTLLAFQYLLPVRDEPPLMEQHWEYLYSRSLGCIGVLKQHLNGALQLALAEGADTITESHLRRSQMPSDKLERAFETILLGEADLREAPDADEKLLRLLNLQHPPDVLADPPPSPDEQSNPSSVVSDGSDMAAPAAKQPPARATTGTRRTASAQSPSSPSPRKSKSQARVGRRSPGRDAIGPDHVGDAQAS